MPKSLFRFAAAVAVMASAPSWALTFQTLYSFPADKNTGKYPEATLTVGPDGQLYGTTTLGGTDDSGTAFKVAPDGAFTLLGSFDRAVTGKTPTARLIDMGDGFLYGAAERKEGVLNSTFGGAIFKVNPAGGISLFYDIPGGGTGPEVPVAITSGEPDVMHVLCSSPSGVLRVPLNGLVTAPTMFNPSGSDGIAATSLVRGTDGKLYGTTQGTSSSGTNPGHTNGTLFRVDGNGSNLTQLFDFLYSDFGANPIAAMAVAPNGVMYGVTPVGGAFSDGIFFKFDPAAFTGIPGTGFTALANLDDVPSSEGSLLLASDGRIYGTSRAYSTGFVWRIKTDGSGFERIVTFNGLKNGASPYGGLVQAPNGMLYGTTQAGGLGGNGTIFRIDLELPPPPVNHPPVAIPDYQQSNGEAVDVDVLANDYDADSPNEDLVITIEVAPTKGIATVVDGKIHYAPTTYAGFDEFKYTVTDPGGLSSTALVTISSNPAPETAWLVTSYNGLVNLDPNLEGDDTNPRGQITLKVAATGKLTGKIKTQGKTVSFRGVITESGVAVATLKMPDRKRADLFMTPVQGTILGCFVFGQETWFGIAGPVAPIAPEKKRVGTVRFDPKVGLPDGYGYGAVKMTTTGTATIVGKLGDGSKLSASTQRVNFNGTAALPLYVNPTKGGYFAGFFEGGADFPMAGDFRWFRKGAAKTGYLTDFSGQVQGGIYPFVPPARGVAPFSFGSDGAGFAAFSGPQFGGTLTGTINQDALRLALNSPLRSISINKATGLFSGKVLINNKSVPFGGAVNQADGEGWGQFLLDKVTGAAVITDDE